MAVLIDDAVSSPLDLHGRILLFLGLHALDWLAEKRVPCIITVRHLLSSFRGARSSVVGIDSDLDLLMRSEAAVCQCWGDRLAISPMYRPMEVWPMA